MSAMVSHESLELPAAACDCHVHVFGPQSHYPMTAQRHYTPGPASLAELQAHLARLGLQRAVIVQASVYGTDNRCMLDSLDLFQGAGRGVAVPDDDASSAEMREMHARGVRAVRVNLESIGARDIAAAHALVARWAARVADWGWHVQLYAAAHVVAALADVFATLPAQVVLDHFALADSKPEYASDGSPSGPLPQLLRTGRVHVKLSAPYRLASPDLATAWARALLQAAPYAVLWGSDWPHTAREPGRAPHEVSAYRAVDPAELATTLHAWLPTPALKRQVLVDNPARLYGF